jgi:hypothetical protein
MQNKMQESFVETGSGRLPRPEQVVGFNGVVQIIVSGEKE